MFYPLEPLDRLLWPGVADWHSREGHKSAYLLPLTYGDGTSKGCIGLVFRQTEALSAERAELALAVAHQVTLCIGLKKLGMAAKNAAVLAERNRIGQEIHDGLAQGFTGILMQLGAAEEAMHECARNSPLPAILDAHSRPREGRARRGAPFGHGPASRSDPARGPGARAEATRRTIHCRRPHRLQLRRRAERRRPRARTPARTAAHRAGGREQRRAPCASGQRAHHCSRKNPRCGDSSVVDDGRGMTLMPELYASQGYGLNNMRERAGAIGGQFQIDSRPGEGTRVIVILPRPAQSFVKSAS